MLTVKVPQVDSLQQLGDLIAVSRARIRRATVMFPGLAPIPFRYELDRVEARQKQIEEGWQTIARQRENLGLVWFAWPAIIAGGSIASWLGLKAWTQHEETGEIEAKMDLYEKLIADGVNPEQAQKMVFGGSGAGALDKLILLGAIAAGVLVFLKMKK